MNFSNYVSRGDDGKVDVDATVSKFRVDLEKFIALQEADMASIASAVAAVFDEHPETSMNLPALASFACRKLNTTPASYADTVERVQDYVRSTKTLYTIKKGKGGGVSKTVPETAPEAQS